MAISFGNAGKLAAQNIQSEKKDSSIQNIGGNPNSSGLDKPIDYKATDSIIFLIKKNKVYLYKNAEILYGTMNLHAYFIEVDLTKKEIFATGGIDSTGKYNFLPVLKDGDDTYTADSMRYNSKTKKGRVYGLRLVQDEAYIHLDRVLKQSDGSFVGTDGKITTCNEDHPHFYFNARRVKVVTKPKNKVFFGPTNLVVEDVPTPLFVPFGLAPVNKGRRNGILFPNPGFNPGNQTFFLQNLGYYTGLGPYADLTISSDAYFNGDLRLGVASNILKRYKYNANFSVNASWFGNGSEITSPTFERKLDFNLRGGFGFDSKFLPGTTLNGNVNIQTGNFNKLNSRSINSFAQNQFNSGINYGRNFFKNRLNFSASARHSQNTADKSFRLEMPSISMGVPSITPFGKMTRDIQILKQTRLSYNFTYNNVLNTSDTLLFKEGGRAELKKIQSGMAHSLPISTNFKLFKGILNFSPSFNYNENWYFKSKIQSADTAGKTLYKDSGGFFRMSRWGVSTSMNTNIYGTLKNLKIGKLRALRHIITPSVSVGYNPEINPDKMGITRTYINHTLTDSVVKYNLYDGIYTPFSQQKSAYLGFGINNNLQAKRAGSLDSNGKEKLDPPVNIIDGFRINGSYNFLADSMNWSSLRFDFNTMLLKLFNIHMDASYSLYGLNDKRKLIKEYAWQTDHQLLTYQNFNATLNTRLSPETFKKKKAEPDKHLSKEEEQELKDIQKTQENYIDFKLPWSVALNYYFTYDNLALNPKDRVSAQRVSVSGDFNITPEWKIGYSTGYDFKHKEIASSEFRISRNLHCWQLEFHWIPSGIAQRWTFTLRPKSGLLQDLKLNKKNSSNPAYFLTN